MESTEVGFVGEDAALELAKESGWGIVSVKPVENLPGIHLNFNPEVVLRFRKLFYPLGFTKLSLGADYHVHKRHWRLKWSWKDRLLGGRIALNGSEVSLNREFRFDARNCVNLRAGFDLHSGKKLIGLDIRPFQGLSSRTSPPGFDFRQSIPLDRRLALGAVGTLTVPQASYGVSDRGVSFGSGNFNVDIHRLDLTFNKKLAGYLTLGEGMAWITACGPAQNATVTRRSLVCTTPAWLIPRLVYRDCLPWLAHARTRPAYRGEELPAGQDVGLVNLASDLLTAYGDDGATFFHRLQRGLSCNADLEGAPVVLESHLLTGSRAEAAKWGPANEVIVIGQFSYLWFAGDSALVFDPVQDALWQQANPNWTLNELVARKGPLHVNKGLNRALEAGHEVLYSAPKGYYLVKSVTPE